MLYPSKFAVVIANDGHAYLRKDVSHAGVGVLVVYVVELLL